MPDDNLNDCLTICDVLEEEMAALDEAEPGAGALRIVEAADAMLREDRPPYLELRSNHHAAVAAERAERSRLESGHRGWKRLTSVFKNYKKSFLEAKAEQDQMAAAEQLRRATEHDRMERLVEILHRKKHAALCFSGGGIRSATFCLGILQGMSHQKLLRAFDYLSTVSGGGYIGSWLSAWMSGHPLPDSKSKKRAGRRSIQQVEAELAKPPAEKLDGELPNVDFLRAYSNYLSPQLGFLSADSWTLVATVIRNMFLNWMILVPMLGAALLAPYLAFQVTRGMNPAPNHAAAAFLTLDGLLIAGFVLAAAALWNIGLSLPSVAGDGGYTQPQYLLYVLLPLVVSAILIDTSWIGFCRLGVQFQAYGFILFGAVLHFLGWFAISGSGVSYIRERLWGAQEDDGFRAFLLNGGTFFALVSGAAGGWAGYYIALLLDPAHHPERATWLALPITLALYFLVAALFVGLASKNTGDEDREWWARSGAWLLMVITAWLIVGGLAINTSWLLKYLNTYAVGSGGLLSGWLGSLIGKSSTTAPGDSGSGSSKKNGANAPQFFSSATLTKYAGKILPVVFLVCLLLVIAQIADYLAVKKLAPLLRGVTWWPRGLVAEPFAAILLILLLTSVAWILSEYVNVNTFSLHAMYRNRLIRAYLGASNSNRHPNPFTGFDPNDNLRMHELTHAKPLHVLNMTLNLVHGERLAWQERKAETFTVTRLHAGSMWVRYRRARHYGDQDGISLGTAMAISGAAASPNMGYHSSPLLTFLMTFFNARLGWWLPNPGPHGKGLWSERGPKSALRSLFAEACGLTDDKSPYVYLSDGGHFENLGLYEMVLRRCHTIVVIDAGADPNYTFDDLANAIRKIRVDLGVPIRLDKPIKMTAGESKDNVHCVTGSIGYACIDTGATDGTLVYIKPVLDDWQSVDLDNYHSAHPDFPQQSTIEQFFDESQFESYRRLGQETIERICHNQTPPIDLAAFAGLARSHSGTGKQAFHAAC